jgi:hypothetical protein
VPANTNNRHQSSHLTKLSGRMNFFDRDKHDSESDYSNASDNNVGTKSPSKHVWEAEVEVLDMDTKPKPKRTFGICYEGCCICKDQFLKGSANQKYCTKKVCQKQKAELRLVSKRKATKAQAKLKKEQDAERVAKIEENRSKMLQGEAASSAKRKLVPPDAGAVQLPKNKKTKVPGGTDAPKGGSVIFQARYTGQQKKEKTPAEIAHAEMLFLPWDEITHSLREKGYAVMNIRQCQLSAHQKTHCELMEYVEADSGLWKSRVHYGWESGVRLGLADIQSDKHQIDKNKLVRIVTGVMSIISQKLYGKELDTTVSYICHKPGKGKQEFVHAESLIRSDLMAIMPLGEDSVPHMFAPYERIRDKPAISRGDKELKSLAGVYKLLNTYFDVLADTTNDTVRLNDSLQPIPVKQNHLLVYVGDVLQARAACDLKECDRLLHFKGKQVGSPGTEVVWTNSPGSPNKQPGNAVGAIPTRDVSSTSGNERRTRSTTNAGNNEAVTGLKPTPKTKDASIISPSKEPNAGNDEAVGGPTPIPETKDASMSSPSKEADGVDMAEGAAKTDGEGKLPSTEVGSPSNPLGIPTDAGSDIAAGIAAPAKKATRKRHVLGAIDALTVLEFHTREVQDYAAAHNLSTAGYTPSEAGEFYKLRYPDAGIERCKDFEAILTKVTNKTKPLAMDLALLSGTVDEITFD